MTEDRVEKFIRVLFRKSHKTKYSEEREFAELVYSTYRIFLENEKEEIKKLIEEAKLAREVEPDPIAPPAESKAQTFHL